MVIEWISVMHLKVDFELVGDITFSGVVVHILIVAP